MVLRSSPPAAKPAVLVLWQSLVVSGYRSFFTQLREATGWRIGLVAPSEFRELGQQLIACQPFAPPFAADSGETPVFVLPAYQPHVQIVLMRGLGAALKAFFAKTEQPQVLLCMAEPYSVTAFAVWLCLRLHVRSRPQLVLFGLQNIQKRLSLPLRLIQALLFRRCAAILSLGEEQSAVLKRHGYKGALIDFPLWFDSSRFQLRPQLAEPPQMLRLGYAGSLSEAKGLLDLLRLLEQQVDDWKERCSVRFAGGGPLAADVETACSRLRQRGFDIASLGPLSGEQMPGFFSTIDILLVPSRTMSHWKEQFGRVIVEARATGAVALGSTSGEIPRVVGGSDRVFAEGDLSSMRAVIDRWLKRLQDPTLRRVHQLSEASAAAAAFSDRSLALRFAQELEELVAKTQ